MKQLHLAWFTAVIGGILLSAQAPYPVAERNDWWNEPYPTPYQPPVEAVDQDFIRVEGNRFVDESGETVVFHGLSIADPDKVEQDGRWSKAHFEQIKDWGANLVRIPVHPNAWRKRGAPAYLELLDQAVDWCGELGMYVIIDWHSIGNLHMELFQHPMYETSRRETLQFWKTIAERYAAVPTVAFYELYNEPTVYRGTLGSCSWEEWSAVVEDIVDLIYAHDRRVIPLVAGFDWAYDLSEVRYRPIAREGIAYVTHPYPGKCAPPREPQWEATFGFLADRYPIIATEMGYYLEGDEHLIDDGTYREAIVRYLEAKAISWCAWVFDPHWHPQMILNYEYEPTHQGEFFRSVMRGEYDFGE